MICCVIKGPNLEKVHEQLAQAKNLCSLVELRLDLFEATHVEEIRNLRKEFSIPMIFTSRSIDQIMKLAHLQPEYIDIEHTVPEHVVEEIKAISPNTKIIISFHDFEKMPKFDDALKVMQKLKGDLYKMAFMLQSSVEALALLQFMKAHAPNVVAMGMGPFGESTRILGPIFGAPFVYACIDQESSTAPGQIPLKTLLEVYHFNKLKSSTGVFGLIGDPVSKSLSHFSHNAVMHDLHLDMVYNKFHVPPEHLADFISEAKKAGIRGLSVTMPLKEHIIPLIDAIDPWAKKVGAVNTLKFENGKITGYNTDGVGALDSIEEKMKVRGKKVVVIGAGGAAKAIIAEAIDPGANVTILNRDEKRALDLAEKMQCKGGSLAQIADGYDILVNATPSPMPIDARWILPKSIVMDIKTRPQYTELLKEAKLKGCTLIFGYEMFVNQAVEQYRIWFGDQIDLKRIKKTIEETMLKNLE